MADNLLKKYMEGGAMGKKDKMYQEGGMMPMEGGAPMEGRAPMEEAPAEGQQGPENIAEQILMQLVEILKSWQDGEYESDAQKADMLAQSVAELIQSYVE